MTRRLLLAFVALSTGFAIENSTPSLHAAAPPGGAGDMIAFARIVDFIDWESEIWISDPDGSHQTRIVSDGTNLAPAWSPDGTQLALSRGDYYQDMDIYLVDKDGTGLTRLTDDSNRWDSGPAWSPDGQRIAFNGGGDIYVVDSDGSGLVNLTLDNSGDDGCLACGLDVAPSWSPDGREIAFASHRTGVQGFLDVFVMDVDGSNVRRLTFGGDAGIPAWSPDGSRIAFCRGDLYEGLVPTHLYVMNSDGSGQTELTHGDNDCEPTWSPDGKWIGFSRGGSEFTILAVNPDGESLKEIVSNGMSPSWGPTFQQQVAIRYAPALYLHPSECFFPMDVDDFLGAAALWEDRFLQPDQPVAGWDHTGTFLSQHNDADYYLNLPGTRDTRPFCNDYKALSSPPSVYARVGTDPDYDRVFVQYWIPYYFNDTSPDWFDHEGDWELVQVVFPEAQTVDQIVAENSSIRPTWVAFSQHAYVQRRDYEDVFTDGLRPVVSVALGSHANSFAPVSCNQSIIANVGIDERLPFNRSDQKPYGIKMIEDESWHNFLGKWGENWPPPGNPPSPLTTRGAWADPIGWMGSNEGHCPGQGTATSITAQSPVDLHLYDALNRHVGPNDTGGIDLEIPGASYAVASGGARQITIEGEPEAPLRLEVDGTGGGGLTLIVSLTSDSGANEYAALYELTVSANSRALLPIAGNYSYDLEVDQDGDGTFEQTVEPTVFGEGEEPPSPTPTPLDTLGDVDCDGDVDAVDALQVLRRVAGLPVDADCMTEAGDVDCDGDIDAVDALLILRHVAGLPVDNGDGCTPIGDPLVRRSETDRPHDELVSLGLLAGAPAVAFIASRRRRD